MGCFLYVWPDDIIKQQLMIFNLLSSPLSLLCARLPHSSCWIGMNCYAFTRFLFLHPLFIRLSARACVLVCFFPTTFELQVGMMFMIWIFLPCTSPKHQVNTDEYLSAEPQQFTQQIGYFVCLILLDRQSSVSAASMLSAAFLYTLCMNWTVNGFFKALDLLEPWFLGWKNLMKQIWSLVVLFSVVESVHHETLDIVCPSQVLAWKWFKVHIPCQFLLRVIKPLLDKLSEMICLWDDPSVNKLCRCSVISGGNWSHRDLVL